MGVLSSSLREGRRERRNRGQPKPVVLVLLLLLELVITEYLLVKLNGHVEAISNIVFKSINQSIFQEGMR